MDCIIAHNDHPELNPELHPGLNLELRHHHEKPVKQRQVEKKSLQVRRIFKLGLLNVHERAGEAQKLVLCVVCCDTGSTSNFYSLMWILIRTKIETYSNNSHATPRRNVSH